MLYEFLCEAYNNNVPFVDTYFQSVFKSRPVYVRFNEMFNNIQDQINEEQFRQYEGLHLKADHTPDMRYKSSKWFVSNVWKDPIVRKNCEKIGKEIREDIIHCLNMALIPMSNRSNRVSPRTNYIRRHLPAMRNKTSLFYASGQLIKNVNIFVEVAA